MKILGIETSCDETSAAIIEADPGDNSVKLISQNTATSLDLHAKTGGIIPDIAARKQVEYIIPVIEKTLTDAHFQLPDSSFQIPAIDAIAVTYGPGLIGSLLIGVETAKTLAFVWNKPVIPVNHLYGHIYANFITTNNFRPTTISFPAIALVVSGGHTDLVLMEKRNKLQLLGGTRDDAAGEALDKIGRMLGLSYPAGPVIERLAQKGNEKEYPFPKALIGSDNFDFSFSGLKTAVFRQITSLRHPELDSGSRKILRSAQNDDWIPDQVRNDIAASTQKAVVDVLVKKTILAAEKFNAKSILLGGGVASNEKLRTQMQQQITGNELKIKLFVPPKNLSTDNAAMIAAAAFFNFRPVPWQEVDANPELYFD